MPAITREVEEGYVVVHHLVGDHEAIEFLRSTSRQVLERLCFQARHQEKANFEFRGKEYVMSWNTDGTFEVKPVADRADIFGG